MVSPMTQTFETSTLHIDESQLYKELPNVHGNRQLTECDAAGKHDPAVAIYVTPEGDFKISEAYEYGSAEHFELSHTLGAIAIDTLPSHIPSAYQLRIVA